MTVEKILHEFEIINYCYNDCTRYDTLERMLNELVESSCKQKWILCSERLPGKGEDVLITNNWHEVRMAYLTDRTRGKVLCWIVDHNSYHPVDRNEILAWMALPHPYIEPTPSEEGETK